MAGGAARRVETVSGTELTGKRAIVTGASSGIGLATARALAEAGVRVAGGARRVERLETEIALELDVTEPESCARFVAAAVEQLGGLDILVNNAGLALGRAPFDESSEEDEATVLGVNVAGLMRMTRLCLPHFAEWGHIVNIGSVAGRVAYEGGASYIAAKFAERGFTYALREDLLGRPLRITTVDPGLAETEFSIVRFKGDAEKAAAVYRGVDPLHPEDIAECIVFALTRPWHVNVDEIVVKARNQASGARIIRDPD
jgi:3-hydroxy acid dehydrogenase / malonic semialdehyde reductase